MGRTLDGRREGGDAYVENVTAIPAPIDFAIPFTSGDAFDVNDYRFAGTSECKLWVHATDANYSGGDSLTLNFYRGRHLVGSTVVSTPSADDGEAGSASVSLADLQYCDRVNITGTITNPSGGTVSVYLVKLGLV